MVRWYPSFLNGISIKGAAINIPKYSAVALKPLLTEETPWLDSRIVNSGMTNPWLIPEMATININVGNKARENDRMRIPLFLVNTLVNSFQYIQLIEYICQKRNRIEQKSTRLVD